MSRKPNLRTKKAVTVRSRGARAMSEDPIVHAHGSYVFEEKTAAATVGVINLSPLLLDARLLALSDNFAEYRFKRVRVTLWPNIGCGAVYLSYTPILPTTAPTTSNMSGQPVFRFQRQLPGGQSIGLSMNVPVRELQSCPVGPTGWFRRGTAYDDLLELQGAVYYGAEVAFSGSTIWIHVEYDIELHAMADAAVTVRLRNPLLTPEEEKLEREVSELTRLVGAAPRAQNPLKMGNSGATGNSSCTALRVVEPPEADDLVLVPRSRVSSARYTDVPATKQ